MAVTANGTHIIFNDNTTQATQGLFASGTVMLFRQNTAPTGWTKSSSFDNAALRVVSGTINATQSGVVPFTESFANTTPSISVNTSGLSAGATTLSTSQIPSHTHTAGAVGTTSAQNGPHWPVASSGTTGAEGGGSSHSHSMSGSASATSSAINLNVRYADAIIASKD